MDRYKSKVSYNWLWDYTSSPMSYLVGGHSWDYFDLQQAYRLQIDSLYDELLKDGHYSTRATHILEEMAHRSDQYYYQTLKDILMTYYEVKRCVFQRKTREGLDVFLLLMVVLTLVLCRKKIS